MHKIMIFSIILLALVALSAWGILSAATPEELEGRIVELESQLVQMKEKVSALESKYHFEAPILVDANDQIVGTVVREQVDRINLLSTQGYAFSVDHAGKITPKVIRYANPICDGEQYIAKQDDAVMPNGQENSAMPGEVFTSGGNTLTASDDLYYVPFTSKETKILESYYKAPSSCSFGGEVTVYPVSLNDPAVTDVERIDYALPLHITVPQQ